MHFKLLSLNIVYQDFINVIKFTLSFPIVLKEYLMQG